MSNTGEWLTAKQAGTQLGCDDQTVIARIKAGAFPAGDVQIRPEGSRPRYLVRARSVGAATEGTAGPEAEGSEVHLLRDELARLRRDLTDAVVERDRLRDEVVALKEAGLHLTRAAQAFLLPRSLND